MLSLTASWKEWESLLSTTSGSTGSTAWRDYRCACGRAGWVSARRFALPFGHRVLIRADLFNAFNHVQYGFPDNNIANANFGRILGTATSYSPRTIQFSLRYQY
mgnify:CR=1 FL=1